MHRLFIVITVVAAHLEPTSGHQRHWHALPIGDIGRQPGRRQSDFGRCGLGSRLAHHLFAITFDRIMDGISWKNDAYQLIRCNEEGEQKDGAGLKQ